MNSKDILGELEKQIESFSPTIEAKNVGRIAQIADGVALTDGLSQVKIGEVVAMPGKTFGLVLNLKKDSVGVIILGEYLHLKEGDGVLSTGKLLEIPVSEKLLGRVIAPFCSSLDGKGPIEGKGEMMPLEKIAHGVVARQPVNTPLQTGIKAIDSITPIGRGQRELIIGDRGTGKTAIAVDTIINQKKENVICVYVAIGQKQSRIAQVVGKLEEAGSLPYTVVVAANAADSVALQYLAPYAGCAIGEYFMGKGKDALIIYDDLTKHAWAYRQISLILRRPSGREAYPGDIFYLHSRLLERACKLNDQNGGGSLTALPIVETQAQDISAYIPTNIISITDGQIYLEPDLFYQGIRPAINVGLSVSRVGGAAQIKAMKKVAGKLRLDLAQYRELAAFSQFSTDLDPATKKLLDRGARITEILKQPQYQPMPIEKQVIIIWAATNGYLDDLPVEKCRDFEKNLLDFISRTQPKIEKEIKTKKDITKKLISQLEKAVINFKKSYSVV